MIAHDDDSCSTRDWHRILRLAHRYPKQMNEALLLVDGARRRRDPAEDRQLSIHALRGDPQWRAHRHRTQDRYAERA